MLPTGTSVCRPNTENRWILSVYVVKGSAPHICEGPRAQMCHVGCWGMKPKLTKILIQNSQFSCFCCIYSWVKTIQSEDALGVRSGLLNSYSFDGIVCDVSAGPDTKNIFKLQGRSFSLPLFLLVYSCVLKCRNQHLSSPSLHQLPSQTSLEEWSGLLRLCQSYDK